MFYQLMSGYIEYGASMQWNNFHPYTEVLIHATTWMSLGNMLSENKQIQMATYDIIPFIYIKYPDRQICRDKNRLVVVGTEGGRNWEQVKHLFGA